MARKWFWKRSARAERKVPHNQTDLQESSDEDLKSPARWGCFGRRSSRAQPAAMKKFGFGKKSEGGDDDRNRAGLFGRKKPAAEEENPYAQQPAEDPYARMTPYQQARANLAAGPQAPKPGAAGLPGGPRPGGGGLPGGPRPAERGGYDSPPPSYQARSQPGGGYAPDRLGVSGGYGSNRYDSDASRYGPAGPTSAVPSQRQPSRGPGGYGGLDSTHDDRRREELLGEARQRHTEPSYSVLTDNSAGDTSGAMGDTSGGGYGEQRELTAEELEQEEYRSIKKEANDVREQTVASSDNAVRQMENSIDVGTGILARLGQQGDSLAKTERNLDLAMNQSRVADEKAGELKTLSRSMFAVHVSNPFTSKSRQVLKEQQILEQHQREAAQREASRQSAFEGAQGMETTFRELNRPTLLGQTTRGASGRSKFMYHEDSDEEGAAEAEANEDKIEKNQAILEEKAPILHHLATALGTEVDRQNKVVDRLAFKSQNVDEGLAVTRYKLSRIH